MRSEPRSYGDPCGIARALDVVGERWSLLIVRELLLGPKRFGQLQRGLAGASPNVLTQRLRDLEAAGVVRRHLLDPPASLAVYELTERGASLEPILLELGRWGSATPRQSGPEMSVDALVIGLKTMFDTSSDARVTYGLDLDGDTFGLAIADGAIDITRGRPERADATLTTDVTTLRMVVFLGTGVRAAEEAGALSITGDRRAAARLPKFFLAPVG